jgi:hypothetical protein
LATPRSSVCNYLPELIEPLLSSENLGGIALLLEVVAARMAVLCGSRAKWRSAVTVLVGIADLSVTTMSFRDIRRGNRF